MDGQGGFWYNPAETVIYEYERRMTWARQNDRWCEELGGDGSLAEE